MCVSKRETKAGDLISAEVVNFSGEYLLQRWNSLFVCVFVDHPGVFFSGDVGGEHIDIGDHGLGLLFIVPGKSAVLILVQAGLTKGHGSVHTSSTYRQWLTNKWKVRNSVSMFARILKSHQAMATSRGSKIIVKNSSFTKNILSIVMIRMIDVRRRHKSFAFWKSLHKIPHKKITWKSYNLLGVQVLLSIAHSVATNWNKAKCSLRVSGQIMNGIVLAVKMMIAACTYSPVFATTAFKKE